MVNMNKYKQPAIYALYVDEGVFCYIGSTSKNSLNRLWEHNYRARNGHSAPVYQWMRFVGIENVKVIDLISLDGVDNPVELEAVTIANYIAAGHPLVNQIARDGVPGSMSEHSKKILSDKAAGKPTWIKGRRGVDAGWTDERRRKQSERMKQRQ
jgi:hypothetical protein